LYHSFTPLLSLSIIFSILPGLASATWYKEELAIMGTSVSVELWHDKRLQAEKCISLVMNNMRRIDQTMSPYKPDSELSRLNKKAVSKPFKASKELFQLISQANKISDMTRGKFDITYASTGYLYDYRNAVRPDSKKIDVLLPAINYRHIKLTPRKRLVKFNHPNVKIDLGGIAKGHAVDQAIMILKRCGISQALVSAGGDSRIVGDKQGLPWMTGIRHPRDKNGFAVVLPLTDTAISTSGDYERFFIENGKRYHHILNPSSGQPADKSQSVTILGKDATTTDALSTAVFVMGSETGLAFIESLPGIEAIIIDSKGKIHYTSGLLKPKDNNNTSKPD